MYTVTIQIPRVVSNNSVNINFIQNVLGTKSLACEMVINLPPLLIPVGLIISMILREMYLSGFRIPWVVSNNSVNINFSQKVLGTKSLALWNDHKLTSITYSCRVNSFEVIVRNVPVRIQKPRVVSNNSVNINVSQKVLGTKSLYCEMVINLLLLFIPVGLIVSKILWGYVPVIIQKPQFVSNNSVNINFSQKVLGTKSLYCEMIINLLLLLIPVGLIVSKILWHMYRSGFRNHELCQVTP